MIKSCLSVVSRWYEGSIVESWCWSLLCVDSGWIDINLQNEHFFEFCTKIGYKTLFNVMITTFENRYILKIYAIVLRPIFNTKYKGGKQVEKYMWDLHQELFLFQQSGNCFCYVPENEIKGIILGWTTSMQIYAMGLSSNDIGEQNCLRTYTIGNPLNVTIFFKWSARK